MPASDSDVSRQIRLPNSEQQRTENFKHARQKINDKQPLTAEDKQALIDQAKHDLKTVVGQYLPSDQVDIVMAACDFADEAHRNDKPRQSGEPYITHPIEVACLLAGKRQDIEIVIAALLHDTVEDTHICIEDVHERFGAAIAHLVDGVTKLKQDKKDKEAKIYNQALSLQKFMNAAEQDLRIVIVKLHDRYHNMTTLYGKSKIESRLYTANETLDIYVPVARVVSMNDLADALENMCYEHLHTETYIDVQRILHNTQAQRENTQNTWKQKLDLLLQEKNLQGRVEIKNNNTALLRNFVNNKLDLFQLTHSHAFNIVLANIEDCDKFAQQLTEQFSIISYTDYIRQPTAGGNQSLRLKLKTDDIYLSLTIQTELMRETSQFGIMLGNEIPTSCLTTIHAMFKYLLRLIDQKCPLTGVNYMVNFMAADKITAYTPKGHPQPLPLGATVIDFAYAVNESLGHRTVGCKIDGIKHPLSTPIKNGQVIDLTKEVLVTTPNPDWLGFVTTEVAITGIQKGLREQDENEQILLGQEALNRILKLYDSSIQQLTSKQWQNLLADFNLDHANALFKKIGMGDLLPQLITNKLFNPCEFDSLIQGMDGIKVTYSCCCNPIFNDPILGHLTLREVIVHRNKCRYVLDEQQQYPDNIMPLRWKSTNSKDVLFYVYLVIKKPLDEQQTEKAIEQVQKNRAEVRAIQHTAEHTYLDIVTTGRKHTAHIMRDLHNQLDNYPSIKRLYQSFDNHAPNQ